MILGVSDLFSAAEIDLGRELLVDVYLHRGKSARNRGAGTDIEFGEEGIGAAGVLELGAEPAIAEIAFSTSDSKEAFHIALTEGPLAHIRRPGHGEALRLYRGR